MWDLIKPVAWFLAIIFLVGVVGKREFEYQQRIQAYDLQVKRLTAESKNREAMLEDTHVIGRQVWAQPPVIKGWMDTKGFLDMLEHRLAANNECNVVIHRR